MKIETVSVDSKQVELTFEGVSDKLTLNCVNETSDLSNVCVMTLKTLTSIQSQHAQQISDLEDKNEKRIKALETEVSRLSKLLEIHGIKSALLPTSVKSGTSSATTPVKRKATSLINPRARKTNNPKVLTFQSDEEDTEH